MLFFTTSVKTQTIIPIISDVNEKYTIEVLSKNDEVYFDVLDYLEHSDSVKVIGIFENRYMISFVTTDENFNSIMGVLLTHFPNMISTSNKYLK